MRKFTKILAQTVVLSAAGWFAGCNGKLEDKTNVVLEVATITIPPVTASTSAGICSFTIPTSSATFNNKPKNSLSGTSTFPYNDIVLQSVSVGYQWDDGAALVGEPFGIGGTVPAGGSAAATFTPVNSTVLATGGARDGHTASLTLTFHGTTVSGDPVSATTGGTLTVNSCLAATLGACCTGGGGCSTMTQVDCTAAGGAYAGDNTSCLTAVCP